MVYILGGFYSPLSKTHGQWCNLTILAFGSPNNELLPALRQSNICIQMPAVTPKTFQLLEKADLPTLLNSRLQDLCILMYKVKHKLCPAYISNIFKEPNSNYNLRQADFSIPRYETVTYGKHSIRYLGPRLWTKLPKSIRDVTTLMSFKSKIRQLNISELLDDGCAGCSLCSFWLLFIFTINLVIR